MGLSTWAVFAGIDEHAVMNGHLALRENELSMALRALRHYDINVVAIHHHMTGEGSKLLSVYFWGKGASVGLAKALKTALDTQTR